MELKKEKKREVGLGILGIYDCRLYITLVYSDFLYMFCISNNHGL